MPPAKIDAETQSSSPMNVHQVGVLRAANAQARACAPGFRVLPMMVAMWAICSSVHTW